MNEEGQIIITLESEERPYSFETFGLDFNSTDEEIIEGIASAVQEDTGVDILDSEDGYWTIKRMENTENIYVFPKSTAGTVL